MIRRNLKKDPPSKYHIGETVRVRVIKQTAAKKAGKKLTLKTHTEGEIIKTDHDKHRYNIKYIDPKSGTMVKKWFSVNDVTSLTLDEEANRQKKAVKETSEKRTKHNKNKSKDTSTNTDASKTTSKNDDDSTLSFELIEEGDNQKNETFKSEGSQLDKSVNEIVENRKLSGDTIGLYFDYLKQKGLPPQVSLANTYFYPSLTRKPSTYRKHIGDKPLEDFEYLIVPVNLPSEDHWLLVVISVIAMCIHIYDSYEQTQENF